MSLENKIYLTKEGLKRFQQEFKALKEAKTLKAKNEVPPSAPFQGIDSEYFTFQEDLDLLESRIEELENVLKNYVLIALPSKSKREIVFLGATVEVEVDGQKDEFTIVGSLEANPMLGRISDESPAGRALLGCRKGDEAKVHSSITTVYKITKVIYKS
jgi:transcription elongation factor GreA